MSKLLLVDFSKIAIVYSSIYSTFCEVTVTLTCVSPLVSFVTVIVSYPIAFSLFPNTMLASKSLNVTSILNSVASNLIS